MLKFRSIHKSQFESIRFEKFSSLIRAPMFNYFPNSGPRPFLFFCFSKETKLLGVRAVLTVKKKTAHTENRTPGITLGGKYCEYLGVSAVLTAPILRVVGVSAVPTAPILPVLGV